MLFYKNPANPFGKEKSEPQDWAGPPELQNDNNDAEQVGDPSCWFSSLGWSSIKKKILERRKIHGGCSDTIEIWSKTHSKLGE